MKESEEKESPYTFSNMNKKNPINNIFTWSRKALLDHILDPII